MIIIDETHDPSSVSWVDDANGHLDFPVQNLPLGIFSVGDAPRGGVAIGNYIVDLAAMVECGLFDGDAQSAAQAATAPTLNALLALGSQPRRALRRRLFQLLTDAGFTAKITPFIYHAADCVLHLPARIGDYTDFYVGIHHATNVGRLFRADNPLLPNYKHVPIGYHGRASSVRVSGTQVIRPRGQIKPPDETAPVLAPTCRLDYELELGVWIGPGNALGKPIPIGQADEHIVGLTLLNDWSARDIQTWEYQPLGPFLAKNFLTTVSPWIVTAEALAPFRIAQPPRAHGDPPPLPYLVDHHDQTTGALAIDLEVTLQSERMRAAGLPAERLSYGPAANMYWTIAQMVAHHSVSGCNLNPGDLLGTGTISAPSHDGYGSLLELTRGGGEPITLANGEFRAFLEDGDMVTLNGRMTAAGRTSIGFGPCSGIIVSAGD